MRNWHAFARDLLFAGILRLALASGVVLLLSATGLTALRVLGGSYRLSLEPGILIAALLLSLIAVEWPWSGRWSQAMASLLRFAAAWVGLVWLFWCLFLPRPMREALLSERSENRVTAVDSRELSPYSSGVHTMAREVGVGMNEAWLPILVLFWLAAFPGFRTLLQVRSERRATGPPQEG